MTPLGNAVISISRNASKGLGPEKSNPTLHTNSLALRSGSTAVSPCTVPLTSNSEALIAQNRSQRMSPAGKAATPQLAHLYTVGHVAPCRDPVTEGPREPISLSIPFCTLGL